MKSVFWLHETSSLDVTSEFSIAMGLRQILVLDKFFMAIINIVNIVINSTLSLSLCDLRGRGLGGDY
jgi:hypothetical protein